MVATGKRHSVPVGDFMLGRVVDGMGDTFLDEGPPVPANAERRAVSRSAPAPLGRTPIDTPLSVAEDRDVKGLYKKARRGELKNFTGIDSPYEAPEHPEIYIDTTQRTSEQSAEAIVEYLQQAGVLSPAG